MKGGNLGTGCSRRKANAFSDGWGRIPDTPLVEVSAAALMRGGRRARSLTGGWSPDDRGRPAYRHVDQAGDEIVVTLARAGLSVEDDARALASQWSGVEGMSPLTLDVLLAVLAKTSACADLAGPMDAARIAVPITARAILHDKGLEQWGAEGAALRERVDAEILRLHRLRFHTRRGGHAAAADRLFEIAGSRPIDSTRQGNARRRETAWLLRPGRWAQAWSTAGDGLWFAALPQSLVQLDHRANRGSAVLAKKIGVSTTLWWGDGRPQGSLQRRICELLEQVGDLPRAEVRGGRWGARTRHRLTRALLLLQEAGVVGEVAWPAGFQPDCPEHGKGWVASWLKAPIVLNVPDAVPASESVAGPGIRNSRRAGRASPKLAQLHRGSVIRALRADHNIPQSRLARELGISAAYLSQIENEHRLASRTVLGRLAGWIQRNRPRDRNGAGEAGEIVGIGTVEPAWQAAFAGHRTSKGASLHMPQIGRPAGKDEQT